MTLKQLAGNSAEEFVLHRAPLLLLDTFIESIGDSTVCQFEITVEWPFVVPGFGVPAYVGVEIMAQCVAVHAGARARVAGFGPPLGFLLGTRHFKCEVPWLRMHETYRVSCRELLRDSQGMGSYDCRITLHDRQLAEARRAVLEKERGRKLDA